MVHTPGHTPGSVCLYAVRDRLLFSGDVLQVIRGRLTFASPLFSHDMAEARASVERLAALEVDTIAFSHYPPWRRDPSGALPRPRGEGHRVAPDRSHAAGRRRHHCPRSEPR